MAKPKKKIPKAVVGGPKEKHKRQQQQDRLLGPKTPLPPELQDKGRATVPLIKSKHHTYFEFVENKGHKKKKLEFKITSDIEPPPGFKFVPITYTDLTKACKELSRERDAMIFIVSESRADMSHQLSHQLHRFGHHIRESLVEEAQAMLPQLELLETEIHGLPEPIPESQDEYSRQVSKALRNLFPNIPNTDREALIVQGFNIADRQSNKVGLNKCLPLHRRIQSSVLAHIRHQHTRYDALIKEVGWNTARRIVEPVCLDILVKWRGDEENGRDQLDEILREVVVISDTDSEESESEEEGEISEELMPDEIAPAQGISASKVQPRIPGLKLKGYQATNTYANGFEAQGPALSGNATQYSAGHGPVATPGDASQYSVGDRPTARKKQSGFKRYQQAWDDAVQRNREEHVQQVSHKAGPVSHGPQHLYEGATPVVPRGASSIPEPNGYVAPYSQAPPPAPYPLAVPRPPYQQVNSGFFGQPQHPPEPPSRVSPDASGLQDMLVRSIEPISPDNVKAPSFVRTLPPRAQLSPVRRSLPYPAAPERVTRDRPFYVGNNRPAESIAQRMFKGPRSHGGSPVPTERPLLPSIMSADPYASSAPAPAQRVAVGVGRPGDSSNPILMEDRGGFYERVHDQPAYGQDPAPHNGAGYWHPERGLVPMRVVSWEEGARYMREAQNDHNIEILSVSRPEDWPRTVGAPMQPHYPRPRYHEEAEPQAYEHAMPDSPEQPEPDDVRRDIYSPIGRYIQRAQETSRIGLPHGVPEHNVAHQHPGSNIIVLK